MDTKGKKILFIDNSLAMTGAFKCADNEATLLANAGNEIFFCLHTDSILHDKVLAKNFTLVTLSFQEIGKSVKKLCFYLPALIYNSVKLKRFVKRHNIDIVQVNDFYNLIGVALKIMGCRVKLITYVRFLPSSLPSPLRKLWTYCAQKFSDKVICVSDAVLKQMPLNKSTIRIYDPVSLEEKHELQPNNSDVTFLYIGNYIQGKGQNFALEAFVEALKTQANIKLLFAGGDMGLQKNKAFKASLEAKVTSLGLEDKIKFLPFAGDVELLIKQADVVLNFSESESFSMTCLEASFYGLPVIATRCGGPEEIIDNEKSGLLVANRSVPEMKDAIIKMANLSTTTCNEMGEAGRIYTRKKFSINSYMAAIQPIIES